MPAQGGATLRESLTKVHVITDSGPGADPVAQVCAFLAAATPELTVQFRPADAWPDREVYHQALAIVALARPRRVKVLINDRVHIALAVDADGAHVGALDLPVTAAREILGPQRILGATARDPQSAQAAIAEGADYVGAGPCYASMSKTGLPEPIGPEGIARISPHAKVIAIGGITISRVPDVMRAGAHGVAVIGAVSAVPDPAAAVSALLKAVRG
jgi:thiamine-phosphate pyrophosphorylase